MGSCLAIHTAEPWPDQWLSRACQEYDSSEGDDKECQHHDPNSLPFPAVTPGVNLKADTTGEAQTPEAQLTDPSTRKPGTDSKGSYGVPHAPNAAKLIAAVTVITTWPV